MNIIRNKSITGNFNTELYNLLNNLSNVPLFHNEHELRHPLGIYSVSSRRVFKSFEDMVSLFNDKKAGNEDLSEAHKEILDSLMAFIDDGYHIMKTLFPKSSVMKERPFANHWLQSVDKMTKDIIDEHQERVKPYRENLAIIVNRIKHNHARYCHVEGNTFFGRVRGYYIEGVTRDGVITPNKEIHPDFEGSLTAISYNWDIKNYMVSFYILSSIIARTFWILVHQRHGIKLTNIFCEDTNDMNILQVCEDIASIPNLFFPDEYNKDIPQIIVQKDKNVIEFRKPAYSSFTKKLPRVAQYKFNTVFTADGVSNSWALPYFKKSN